MSAFGWIVIGLLSLTWIPVIRVILGPLLADLRTWRAHRRATRAFHRQLDAWGVGEGQPLHPEVHPRERAAVTAARPTTGGTQWKKQR